LTHTVVYALQTIHTLIFQLSGTAIYAMAGKKPMFLEKSF